MPKYSNEFKLSVITRVRGGESRIAVARELGICVSTLRGWCTPQIERTINLSRERELVIEQEQLIEGMRREGDIEE